MQKLADISFFESLGCQPARQSCMSVFNSDAAPLLQEYGRTKRAAELTEKFISELQTVGENAPSSLLSTLLEAKEKADTELLTLRQQIVEQTEQSGLDSVDREVFSTLPEAAQTDLEGVIASDAVFQRAREMAAEAASAPPDRNFSDPALAGTPMGDLMAAGEAETAGDLPVEDV